MKVLIAGGGNVGRHLGRILVRNGHEVTVVERDASVLGRVREESGAAVVHGDATEPSLLEQCGIRAMDVVVAATGDDEDNLVVAGLAKFEFEVRQVVARVKNALNAWLYEPDMGVDMVVSAPHQMARLIEEQVALGDVARLLALGSGQAALIEATLAAGSPVAGRRASEVDWPADCVLSAVIRGARVLTPAGDLVLAAGDRLVCVTAAAAIDSLHALIGTTPAQ